MPGSVGLVVWRSGGRGLGLLLRLLVRASMEMPRMDRRSINDPGDSRQLRSASSSARSASMDPPEAQCAFIEQSDPGADNASFFQPLYPPPAGICRQAHLIRKLGHSQIGVYLQLA